MKYSNDYIISTSWLTITKPGERGQSQHHFHKNRFYSGVYYYDEYEKDTGELEFPLHVDGFDIHMNTNKWGPRGQFFFFLDLAPFSL